MKKIINPWTSVKGYNCFGCSPTNRAGVRMEFYDNGDEIVSIWHPEPQYQGWLRVLHGGIQAVLIDEVSAWVVTRKMQTFGVTSKLETRYKKQVSTDEPFLILRARLVETRRNLAVIDANLYNSKGELCCEGHTVYFTYPPQKTMEEMFFKGCEVEPEEVFPPEMEVFAQKAE